MEVKYICVVTGKEVVGAPDVLPEGWMIPPMDVSSEGPYKVLPYRSVLALSSKDAWRKFLKKRITND